VPFSVSICLSPFTLGLSYIVFQFIIFLSSVGNETGSFGFSALALRVGKNQMCLFARELSLYAAQRLAA